MIWVFSFLPHRSHAICELRILKERAKDNPGNIDLNLIFNGTFVTSLVLKMQLVFESMIAQYIPQKRLKVGELLTWRSCATKGVSYSS